MIDLKSHKVQVLVLFISSILGTLIGMLNSVLNTRFLSPEEFGDVRYVQNMIAFISSFLLFGYFISGSRLLALSSTNENSRRLRGVMCTILLISNLILICCLLVLYIYNINYSNAKIADLYLYGLPVCGNALMLNYINTTAQGDNHILRIALARLLPSLTYLFIAYYVFTTFGATSKLMLILFNGTSVVVLLLIILSTNPSFKKTKETFKILREENSKYGFNVYIGSLINVSTGYLSGITLGLFAETNENVGFYTLALSLTQPLVMLPTIVGTTYFKQFATQTKIDKKVLKNTLLISAISCLGFILCIKFVVLFLYDETYYSVSYISACLAFGVSFHGIGDVLNRFLGAHGKGKEIRNAAFGCGVILIIGSSLFVYYLGINGAILTKILSSLTYFAILLFYYMKFIKNES